MGRKGRGGSLPAWYKGQKLIDCIDGSEIYELDSSTVIQRGMYMHKKNFDSLTEEDRQLQIRVSTSRGRTLSAASGATSPTTTQGNYVRDDEGNIVRDDEGNPISF